jgi:hypothetical protein
VAGIPSLDVAVYDLQNARTRSFDGDQIILGSGANFLKCMFLSGQKALQILSGQDHGPNFRSGGCFSC